MGVEIKGEEALVRELERRFGKARVRAISDKALTEGAKVFAKELRRQFEGFRDTGASIEEITISKPKTVGGERRVTVHWRGPENRYRIIHLNEFGTVNNPNPAGKGAIARALRNSEKEYRRAVRREVEAMARG